MYICLATRLFLYMYIIKINSNFFNSNYKYFCIKIWTMCMYIYKWEMWKNMNGIKYQKETWLVLLVRFNWFWMLLNVYIIFFVYTEILLIIIISNIVFSIPFRKEFSKSRSGDVRIYIELAYVVYSFILLNIIFIA